MTIDSKEQLLDYVNAGNSVKYLFFWGHTNRGNAVNATCLSQWYPTAFDLDGRTYPTAEHFMMAEKAKLFGDDETHRKVFKSQDPGFAKAVGREVRGFKESIWTSARMDIVERGNYAKFDQNSELKGYLLGTKGRVLVEASPHDRIWGIGLTKDDAGATNPNFWKGQNLLGFALMNIREMLKDSSKARFL